MHIVKSILFSLVIALSFTACNTMSQKAEDNPVLKEAFEYHTQAIEASKDVKEQLNSLVQQKNSLKTVDRQLTPAEMTRIDAINGLEKAYNGWKKNLVEVPGFEHSHDHSDHDHDHSHGTNLQLTPEEMLEVQKEALKGIKDLAKKAKDLAVM